MKISILSLFPSMYDGFLNTSIIKRAIEKEKVEIEVLDFRNFTDNKHNKVDDTIYGGGQGMLLMVQPIVDCLKSIKTENSHVVLLGPIGETFNQKKAHELKKVDHLILICGHYEGIDHRIRYYIDEELSIGDYILTGGELASMVIADAVIRLKNDVILQSSHEDESFENGLLEYPQYTKPYEYDGHVVPDVLVSGHHENIRKWKLEQSIRLTLEKRKDLLERELSKEEESILKKIGENNEY